MTLRVGVQNDLGPGLAKAKADVSGFTGAVSGFQAALAAVGGTAVVAFVKGVVDSAEKTTDLAAKLGVTTEALTRLQHAAEINGSSGEALADALTKMNRTLGEASTGGHAAAAAFSDIGLNVRDLVNLKPDEAFAAIAEQISHIENPALRAKAAVDIFGRGGQEVTNVLRLGKQGLRDFGDEADRLGITLSTKAAGDLGALKDNIDRLTGSFEALKREAVATGAPALTGLSDILTTQIGLTRNAFGSVTDFSKALGFLANPVGQVTKKLVAANAAAADYGKTLGAASLATTGFAAASGSSAVGGSKNFKPPTPPENFLKDREHILRDLIRQQEEFGLSDDQLAIRHLADAGATQEELRYAAALIKSTNAMKEKAEAARTLEDRVNAQLDSFFDFQDQVSEAKPASANFGHQLAGAEERRFAFGTSGGTRDTTRLQERIAKATEDSRKDEAKTATATTTMAQKLSSASSIGIVTIN